MLLLAARCCAAWADREGCVRRGCGAGLLQAAAWRGGARGGQLPPRDLGTLQAVVDGTSAARDHVKDFDLALNRLTPAAEPTEAEAGRLVASLGAALADERASAETRRRAADALRKAHEAAGGSAFAERRRAIVAAFADGYARAPDVATESLILDEVAALASSPSRRRALGGFTAAALQGARSPDGAARLLSWWLGTALPALRDDGGAEAALVAEALAERSEWLARSPSAFTNLERSFGDLPAELQLAVARRRVGDIRALAKHQLRRIARQRADAGSVSAAVRSLHALLFRGEGPPTVDAVVVSVVEELLTAVLPTLALETDEELGESLALVLADMLRRGGLRAAAVRSLRMVFPLMCSGACGASWLRELAGAAVDAAGEADDGWSPSAELDVVYALRAVGFCMAGAVGSGVSGCSDGLKDVLGALRALAADSHDQWARREAQDALERICQQATASWLDGELRPAASSSHSLWLFGPPQGHEPGALSEPGAGGEPGAGRPGRGPWLEAPELSTRSSEKRSLSPAGGRHAALGSTAPSE